MCIRDRGSIGVDLQPIKPSTSNNELMIFKFFIKFPIVIKVHSLSGGLNVNGYDLIIKEKFADY